MARVGRNMKFRTYKPTHPELVEVIHPKTDDDSDSETFDSKLVAKRHFSKGQTIAKLEKFTPVDKPTYLTVQVGENSHILLNSDFQYLNHSCSPNVKIDTSCMAYVALKDISPGEEMTFFYPSTEWDMDQAFSCWCGSPQCLGKISGAKSFEPATRKKMADTYFLNKHILEKLGKVINISNTEQNFNNI